MDIPLLAQLSKSKIFNLTSSQLYQTFWGLVWLLKFPYLGSQPRNDRGLTVDFIIPGPQIAEKSCARPGYRWPVHPLLACRQLPLGKLITIALLIMSFQGRNVSASVSLAMGLRGAGTAPGTRGCSPAREEASQPETECEGETWCQRSQTEHDMKEVEDIEAISDELFFIFHVCIFFSKLTILQINHFSQ